MRRRLLRLPVAAGVGETACEAVITCRQGEDRTGENVCSLPRSGHI